MKTYKYRLYPEKERADIVSECMHHKDPFGRSFEQVGRIFDLDDPSEPLPILALPNSTMLTFIPIKSQASFREMIGRMRMHEDEMQGKDGLLTPWTPQSRGKASLVFTFFLLLC